MFELQQPSGEILPIRAEDLDEDLRRGRIDPRRRVRHPEWTGGELKPMDQVPELREACATDNARMASTLWRPGFAWLCHLLTALVVITGVPQLLADFAGQGQLLDTVWTWTATGFDPVVLDGRFWTPWTTQLSHSGLGHLAGNVAVLGYCGYRVERAARGGGLAFIAAMSVGVGAACIALFEHRPVVGSSILAFGLWGAQIALGFRFGDGLAPRWRRFYGYGNLALFALLFAGTFRGGELVSHWGHAGGLAGGVLGAFLVRPWNPLLNLAGMVMASGVTLLIGPGLGAAMPHMGHEEVNAEGLSLRLPSRMVETWSAFYTLNRAWTSDPTSSEALFAGELRMAWRSLDEGDLIWGPDLVTWMRDRFGVEAELLEEPEVLGPGWNVTALRYEREGVTYRHVEHHYVRGIYLNRVGYVVREGAERREAWFQQVLQSVQPQEIPLVAAARAEHERNPKAERLKLDYARELRNAGEPLLADALLAEVVAEGTQRRDEAALLRLDLWGRSPMMFEHPGQPWFSNWLDDFPADGDLAYDAVKWFVAWERCDEALRVAEAVRAEWPDDTGVNAIELHALDCP